MSGLITYPFPLEDGTQGFFYLPAHLTAEDVERMTAFLDTLVIDPTPTDDVKAVRDNVSHKSLYG